MCSTSNHTLKAIQQCLDVNQGDIRARADFMSSCAGCIVQHQETFLQFFNSALVSDGMLGSFRGGYAPDVTANPKERYSSLLGCCLTISPRGAATITGEMRAFARDSANNFPDVANIFNVCNNKAWTKKHKLVVLKIEEEQKWVRLILVSEEHFGNLVSAFLNRNGQKALGEDFFQNPAALCAALCSSLDVLFTDATESLQYVLTFHLPGVSSRKAIGYDLSVQLLKSIQGTITKLVTLSDTSVRNLSSLYVNTAAASGKKAGAGAARSAIDTSSGSYNSKQARAYCWLVPKPEPTTFPGLYLAHAQAAAAGHGFASRNAMRQVFKAIGEERVKALTEDRVPIGDLPDLKERFDTLVLLHCPLPSDAMELSRCIALLRELGLVDLGLFDVCFSDYARIDALIESYMVGYQGPCLTWDGALPNVRDFSEMISGTVNAAALPPLGVTDPRPAFVADDWVRLLCVVLLHVQDGHSLDTVHPALALASHSTLRMVARADTRELCYFALNWEFDAFQSVIEGVIREIRYRGCHAILHCVPGYSAAVCMIPTDYELFVSMDSKWAPAAADAGSAPAVEDPSVRRSGRAVIAVERYHDPQPGRGGAVSIEAAMDEAGIPVDAMEDGESSDAGEDPMEIGTGE